MRPGQAKTTSDTWRAISTYFKGAAAATPVESILDGTPYSLPRECSHELEKLVAGEKGVRSQVGTAIAKFQQRGLLSGFKRNQDYRLVHESNRLELEGPDLRGTVEAIQSELGQEIVSRGLDTGLLVGLMQQDRDTYLALGLEGARILAEDFVASGRPLTETSLRGLHAMIAAGEPYAGKYRSEAVSIGGSEHQPPEHIAVPALMYELVAWLRATPPGHAILKASIAHAWLTHIHPFQDGNGRVARLLANIILAQSSLPPAIVKARTHRSRYLDVLSGSDPGGDILPVSGLFLDTLRRYAREMNRPGASRQLFTQLLNQRGTTIYEWFNFELQRFLRELSVQLFTMGLALKMMDSLDQADFNDLRAGSKEKTLIAAVVSESGRPIFMFLEAPTQAMRERLVERERLPSVGFAVRNEPNRLYAFRRAAPIEVGGLSEIWIQTIHHQYVNVRRYDSNHALFWFEAVELVARELSRAAGS
jgi:fido (protein-threonine AMPylation protein)